MAPRYALYYAPPAGSALDGFGRRWLGRDARTGECFPCPARAQMDQGEWFELTASPRRYGFHATLKPPFALKDEFSSQDLLAALDLFCRNQAGILLPEFQIADLGGFLALTPHEHCQEVAELASACVREFDRFRRPSDDQEVQRRRTSNLTDRQETLLLQFGYPYVLDEFRFHLTLTGKIKDGTKRERIKMLLEDISAPVLMRRQGISAICLFVEDRPGDDLRMVSEVLFPKETRKIPDTSGQKPPHRGF